VLGQLFRSEISVVHPELFKQDDDNDDESSSNQINNNKKILASIRHMKSKTFF
jgi:hypothetical protein